MRGSPQHEAVGYWEELLGSGSQSATASWVRRAQPPHLAITGSITHEDVKKRAGFCRRHRDRSKPEDFPGPHA